jgi:adenylosuccinate synthase
MNIVVIGAQWGDEGKGKIVDFLADNADAIVRYGGGANAGHTIVLGDEQYALHLVPSGILHPGKRVFLGSGMVIDPEALFSELDMLKSRGVSWEGRVRVSDRAHLVLPRYREIDKEKDARRAKPIGTTGRGIGVAYSLKSDRDGVRLADLRDRERLALLTGDDRAFLAQYTERLLSLAVDIASEMRRLKGKNVLLEGAQGTLLDLDVGTYPFVSSGMSCAAGAPAGAGIGPRSIDTVIGVFKAYSTRVGNGPMPSEFDEATEGGLCAFVRDAGREYGVTTGRPRRCGYLDLVALRYACRVNSIDSLALTHLDIYDSLPEIEACVAYTIQGKETADFPASIGDLTAAKPVLKKFPGWNTGIKSCRSWESLPKNARDYVSFIEDYTETPAGIISVGYDRADTIIRKNPWER